MTKKLGELLNLPDLPGSDFKDSEPVSQETIDEIANSQAVINDVNTATVSYTHLTLPTNREV